MPNSTFDSYEPLDLGSYTMKTGLIFSNIIFWLKLGESLPTSMNTLLSKFMSHALSEFPLKCSDIFQAKKTFSNHFVTFRPALSPMAWRRGHSVLEMLFGD
jgi:hypothetical protein